MKRITILLSCLCCLLLFLIIKAEAKIEAAASKASRRHIHHSSISLPDSVIPLEAVIQKRDVSCYGEENGMICISNISGGVPPYTIRFNGRPSNLKKYEKLQPDQYQLTIEDSLGNQTVYTVSIHEPAPIVISLKAEHRLVLGDTIQLIPEIESDYALQCNWSPRQALSCTDCKAPRAFPRQNITYEIFVIDSNNCLAEASTQVIIDKRRRVYIPNAFSPNGDGVNDFMGIYTDAALQEIRYLRIFNRWGKLVYQKNNMPAGSLNQLWDGRQNAILMPLGTYIYSFEATFIDGESKVFSGEITLFR